MFKQITKSLGTAFSSDPLREFKVDPKSAVLTGPHNIYSVSNGVERSTGKNVSIFTISRKGLILKIGSPQEADALLEMLKRGVSLLHQLRHPSLLSIYRPWTVDGSFHFFVTERVSGSLQSSSLIRCPIQVKKVGLQRIISGIRFLQERCNLFLLDFGPHAVFSTENGWKIGGLGFCYPSEEVDAVPLLRAEDAAARPLSVPLLDYLADECFSGEKNGSTNHSVGSQGLSQLFAPGPSDSRSLGSGRFAHTATFSFVITATEILAEKRLYNTRGSFEERRIQSGSVNKEISKFFPMVLPLGTIPRAPLSSIALAPSIYDEETRILMEVESFDIESATPSFDVLKVLHDNIKNNVYCPEILVQVVIPFAFRGAKKQNFQRFVLPIVIQCALVLPEEKAREHLKSFCQNVMHGIVTAPSFELTGVLAQQLLEKQNVIQRLFTSTEDMIGVVLPFFIKSLSLPTASSVSFALRGINQLFLTIKNPSKIKFPPQFLDKLFLVLQNDSDETFFLSCEALTTVMQYLTVEDKCKIEVSLIQGLKTNFLTRPKRLVNLLALLFKVQDSMPAEHLAQVSIPTLSPLLLSSNRDVRSYVASFFSKSFSKFDVFLEATTATGAGGKIATVTPSWAPLHSSLVSTTQEVKNDYNSSENIPSMPSFACEPKNRSDPWVGRGTVSSETKYPTSVVKDVSNMFDAFSTELSNHSDKSPNITDLRSSLLAHPSTASSTTAHSAGADVAAGQAWWSTSSALPMHSDPVVSPSAAPVTAQRSKPTDDSLDAIFGF